MNFKILIICAAFLSLLGCSSPTDGGASQLPSDKLSENNKVPAELKNVLSSQVQKHISKYSPDPDYSFVLFGKTFGAPDSDYQLITFLPVNIGSHYSGSINLNNIRLEIGSNTIGAGNRHFFKYKIKQHLFNEFINCASTESGIIPLCDEPILIKHIEVEEKNSGGKFQEFAKANATGDSRPALRTNNTFTQKNEYLLVVFARDKQRS